MKKFKSIKSKLILFYSFILFVIISIFVFSLYYTMKNNLMSAVNSKIEFIQDELKIFTQNELDNLLMYKNNRKFIYEEDPDFIIFDKSDNKFKINSKGEIEYRNFYIEIINLHNRKSVLKSLNMKQNMFKINSDIYNENTKYKTIDFITKDYKSIYKTLVIDKKYLIIVSTSIKNIEEQMMTLLIYSFSFACLLFIASIFLAFILIRKIIEPMNNITLSAKQLNANDLSKRLNVLKSNDEFEQLGDTFNDMFEQIEDSFIQLKKFNSDASHELKTPLTIIIGEIEVLLKKPRSNDEYKNTINSIHEETKNLISIVNTLLMLTSINNKDIKNSFKINDINSILLKVYEEYFFIAQEKKIMLDIKNIEIIELFCNDLLIKSVFTNIIDNAIKYSPKFTKVLIDLKIENESLYFTVIDEGIGIKEEDKKDIFSRFFRSEKSHNKKIKGYGLGLSIVKHIIKLHNGQINIRNNKVNGTVFEIIIPL